MNQKMLKSWCPSCPQFLGSLLCKGQTNTGSFFGTEEAVDSSELDEVLLPPLLFRDHAGGGGRERGVITCRLCHKVENKIPSTQVYPKMLYCAKTHIGRIRRM